MNSIKARISKKPKRIWFIFQIVGSIIVLLATFLNSSYLNKTNKVIAKDEKYFSLLLSLDGKLTPLRTLIASQKVEHEEHPDLATAIRLSESLFQFCELIMGIDMGMAKQLPNGLILGDTLTVNDKWIEEAISFIDSVLSETKEFYYKKDIYNLDLQYAGMEYSYANWTSPLILQFNDLIVEKQNRKDENIRYFSLAFLFGGICSLLASFGVMKK